jgi:uroporphyrinogen-III synthase
MSRKIAYLLSTQALPESLVFEAAARGVMIDSLSFIATEPVKDDNLGDKIRELKQAPLTVVFTSVNAVEAVKGGGHPEWRIFCTGGATRRAVEAWFGEEAIAGVAETAKGLAEEMIRSLGNSWGWEVRLGQEVGIRREIWFFCGDQRRDELPFILKQAGFVVHEVVVYRTKQTPHRVTRDYSGIAFFSPSAVESFFSVNQAPPGARLYAIGPTTAAAIREKCDNPVVTVELPEKRALIRKMIEDFQLKNG